MAELDANQIKELANSAQEHKGCAFRDQFVNMSLDEQLKAMRDLRAQQEKLSQPYPTAMQFKALASRENNQLTLSVRRPFDEHMFIETVDLTTGEKTYSCKDKGLARIR